MSLKRIILAAIIISFLLIVAIFLLIPNTFEIQVSTKVKCNIIGACRVITSWNSAFVDHTDTSFSLNHYKYVLKQKFSNGGNFTVSLGKQQYETNLLLLRSSMDTSILSWSVIKQTGFNPVTKLTTYFELKALEENLNRSSKLIGNFLNNDSNIYKLKITHTTLTDTFLISVKQLFSSKPTTNQLYSMITLLKNYSDLNHAKQTNYPMLNSMQTDSGIVIMIALPVNKWLPASKSILPKMLSPIKDKILTATVSGGLITISNAYKQIELYMQDNSLEAPVIPFEYLETERNKQPDTAKWITKIYYPII